MPGKLNRLQVVDDFRNAVAHLIRVSRTLRMLPHLFAPYRHIAGAMSLYLRTAVHEAGDLVFLEWISVFPREAPQVGRRRSKLML